MRVTLSASFGSGSTDAELLRCAQDDRQDSSQARSREVLSPNVYILETVLDILTVIGYTAIKKVAVIWNPAKWQQFQTDD